MRDSLGVNVTAINLQKLSVTIYTYIYKKGLLTVGVMNRVALPASLS